MLTIIGALLGSSFGGFPGLLIGGLIGYAASELLRRFVTGGLQIAQSQLVDSTFSIMGALCKADKVVTRDEIQAVERMFTMLKLHGEQREQARAAFGRGKQSDFDLDAAVDKFRLVSRGRGPLLQLFLQLQCMAVVADGRVDPAEHAMLVRIALRLGLKANDVAQIEALLRAATNGPASAGGRARQDRLADAYAALGIPADSKPADIKRAYRKLISQNHPDKLASRGLPDSMRLVAEERSREINSAYDLIKSARPDVR
ncbi:MAG: co-chaperone DjlA [Proteobacteria bacterium]|nr:co-chaperone DjlA [Pseudomonadota bacterium]MDA1064818.1 co-chaperone DjlA [Pseudomonadota bacterium]